MLPVTKSIKRNENEVIIILECRAIFIKYFTFCKCTVLYNH